MKSVKQYINSVHGILIPIYISWKYICNSKKSHEHIPN